YILLAYAVGAACVASILCRQCWNNDNEDTDVSTKRRTVCRVASWAFVCFLGSAYSFMANNSANWFESPAASHKHPCGLEVPPGHTGNNSAQYHGEGWIWVDLEPYVLEDRPQAVQTNQWEYNEACLKIYTYDIVRAAWAADCSNWCEEHFGNFVWNQLCAFGMVPEEISKPMNVLRACQKAIVFRYNVQLTAGQCWLIGLGITLISVAAAACLFFGEELTPSKFETADKSDGKLKLAPFVSIPGFTRLTEIRFGIFKMVLSLTTDIVSDFVSGLVYLCKGQVFFGAFIMLIVAIGNMDDMFGVTAFADAFRSVRLANPAPVLIGRKARELTEASAIVTCAVFFLLKVPAHAIDDRPMLSPFDLFTFLFSLVTNVIGIFEGAEASIQAHVLRLQTDAVQDMDLRYELFQSRSAEMTLFAIAATIARLSGGLAMALVLQASETPFVTVRCMLSEGAKPAILTGIVLCCVSLIPKWRRSGFNGMPDIVNVVNIFTDVIGFLSFAGLNCVAGGYLHDLKKSGGWDNSLPWSDLWFHLSKSGIQVDRTSEKSWVVLSMQGTQWLLLWTAEITTGFFISRVAAVIVFMILLKTHVDGGEYEYSKLQWQRLIPECTQPIVPSPSLLV
ncbi:unnamed protein product, partial [Symbiodinium sp. CCMP2456]